VIRGRGGYGTCGGVEGAVQRARRRVRSTYMMAKPGENDMARKIYIREEKGDTGAQSVKHQVEGLWVTYVGRANESSRAWEKNTFGTTSG